MVTWSTFVVTWSIIKFTWSTCMHMCTYLILFSPTFLRLQASAIICVTTTPWRPFWLVYSALPFTASRKLGRRCLQRGESKCICACLSPCWGCSQLCSKACVDLLGFKPGPLGWALFIGVWYGAECTLKDILWLPLLTSTQLSLAAWSSCDVR